MAVSSLCRPLTWGQHQEYLAHLRGAVSTCADGGLGSLPIGVLRTIAASAYSGLTSVRFKIARVDPISVEIAMATLSTRQNRRRDARPIAPPRSNDVEVATRPNAAATVTFIEPERRHALICEAAYFRAEQRGFCPGGELDDWLAAENEIDRALQSGGASS
jgi:Protein of unknown function (DUF2934)